MLLFVCGGHVVLKTAVNVHYVIYVMLFVDQVFHYYWFEH